jgi:hypothetical protein
MSAAPLYGLRYGFVLATGDLQRLRGRPPLVSPLESCMGRSSTAVDGRFGLRRNLRSSVGEKVDLTVEKTHGGGERLRLQLPARKSRRHPVNAPGPVLSPCFSTQTRCSSPTSCKKLKLKMIFKKVQGGCKIRRTYRIFGYTQRDKLFMAFEADRFNHSRTSPQQERRCLLARAATTPAAPVVDFANGDS